MDMYTLLYLKWITSTVPRWRATMKKAAAEDVNVAFEDQQKINKFARNTSRITELKEETEKGNR